MNSNFFTAFNRLSLAKVFMSLNFQTANSDALVRYIFPLPKRNTIEETGKISRDQ